MAAKLVLCLALFTTAVIATDFNVQPFQINLSSEIPRLQSLVNNSRLPAQALYDVGQDKGIELDFLAQLKSEWVGSYDWESQQAELNEFTHFTADIEGIKIHFVYEKSTDTNAIPIILLHGWPGSFFEFAPIIKPLSQSRTTSAGKNVSFNVVVPSLPGFVFSSPAPSANWTYRDTARVFNTLMTEVLGYSTYALHGTDWGSAIGYSLYESFNTTVRAAHFAFLPFLPPSPEDLAAKNISISAVQNVTERKGSLFISIGSGYFNESTTKPNDIGLALYDSPAGQLAWIGGKMKLWSDPRAGTPPSQLTHTALLTSISLYYLTSTFLSATWIYASNPGVWRTQYTPAPTDAPLLFSQFEYNVGLWPEEYVANVTRNLVRYTVHDFGGHFPGLDNPPAMVGDVREIGDFW